MFSLSLPSPWVFLTSYVPLLTSFYFFNSIFFPTTQLFHLVSIVYLSFCNLSTLTCLEIYSLFSRITNFGLIYSHLKVRACGLCWCSLCSRVVSSPLANSERKERAQILWAYQIICGRTSQNCWQGFALCLCFCFPLHVFSVFASSHMGQLLEVKMYRDVSHQ